MLRQHFEEIYKCLDNQEIVDLLFKQKYCEQVNNGTLSSVHNKSRADNRFEAKPNMYLPSYEYFRKKHTYFRAYF